MRTALPFIPAIQTASDDGLTLRNILGALPTDPASIFVILLLAGSLALVLWAGRPKGKGGRPAA
jgi:hypothetical protein